MPGRRAGGLGVPAWLGRRCGGDIPAHPGRRQIAPGVEPDEIQRHAMALRRQSEAARGGKIERARIAQHLSDNESDVAAPHPFLQREQRIFGRVGKDMDHPAAHVFGQAGAIGSAHEPRRLTHLHPQDRAAILRLAPFGPRRVAPVVERESERGGGPAAIPRWSENLAMAGGRAPLRRQSRPPARRTLVPQRRRADGTADTRDIERHGRPGIGFRSGFGGHRGHQ